MATIPTEDPTPSLNPPTAPDPAADPNAWVRWFARYKRASRPLQIGIGCASLFVACALCSTAVGVLANVGGAPAAAVTQATDTTVTQATANPNASAPAYLAVVRSHASTMSAVLSQVGTDCGATDAQALATCRTDLQAVHDGAVDFIAALDAQPAPPCLQTADQQLREGLTSIENGATLGMQGIDQYSAADLQAGGTLISEGGTNIQRATTAFNQASCS